MMVLDKRLGETAWLAGDDYTIADMATLPYLRRQFIDKVGRFPNVERWGAAMLDRPAVAEGMQVGIVRAETIEGGLTGVTDTPRAILWGDRQHAARDGRQRGGKGREGGGGVQTGGARHS